MTKNKTYKSDAFAAIHETVSDLYAAGVINKQTMRDFDESCLTVRMRCRGRALRRLNRHQPENGRG